MLSIDAYKYALPTFCEWAKIYHMLTVPITGTRASRRSLGRLQK